MYKFKILPTEAKSFLNADFLLQEQKFLQQLHSKKENKYQDYTYLYIRTIIIQISKMGGKTNPHVKVLLLNNKKKSSTSVMSKVNEISILIDMFKCEQV